MAAIVQNGLAFGPTQAISPLYPPMGGSVLTEPLPVSTAMAPGPLPVGPTSHMSCNSSAGERAFVKPFFIALYYFRIHFDLKH